ncbi:hypothetical protein E8E14_013036 [Neopestalotiopsis sp. 37M]|nr:hypothetical protein E8E14_013036 [Neopestalotiopsis sp. 37M]
MALSIAFTDASTSNICEFGYYSSLSRLVATNAPVQSWCNLHYPQQLHTTEITVTNAATVTVEVTPTRNTQQASIITVIETETAFATPTTITRKEFPTLSETITSVVTITSTKSVAAGIVTSTSTVCPPLASSTGLERRWTHKTGGKKSPLGSLYESNQRQPSYGSDTGYLVEGDPYNGGSTIVLNPSETTVLSSSETVVPDPSETAVLNPSGTAILDPTLCSCIAMGTSTVTTTIDGAAFTTSATATLRPLDPAISTSTATTTTTARRVVATTLTSTVTHRTTITNTVSTTITTTVAIATVTSSEFTIPASSGDCGCAFAVQCEHSLVSFDLDGIFQNIGSLAECIDLCNTRQECAAAEFAYQGYCVLYSEFFSGPVVPDPERIFAVKQVNSSCNLLSDTCIYDGP